LSGPGVARAAGTLHLTPALREELQNGQLELVLYTADTPGVPVARAVVPAKR